jgi:hypothetical protein
MLRALIADSRKLMREAEDRSFVAAVLDKASRDRLLRWWKTDVKVPFLSRLYGHHMTLVFRPSPDEVARLPVGEKVTLRVTGWAADNYGQAVQLATTLPTKSVVPHITIAISVSSTPAYSNALLNQQSIQLVHGPTLSATVDHVKRTASQAYV